MARFRSRSFRASAVSIVAAFAPAGCESESASEPATSCPAEQPKDGDSCQGPLNCGYEYCAAGSATVRATCLNGSFAIYEETCNPPAWSFPRGSRDAGVDAGDASITSCPAQPPPQGQRCAEGLACGYDRCPISGGQPTREALCIDGVITVRLTSCNPPSPDASFVGDASRSDASTDASQSIDGG
jgi:hypothetical protein